MINCRCDLNLEIQEARPKTADEIKAEYERLELDLHIQHEQQIADLEWKHQERLQKLCEQRGIELAEVVDPAVVKTHTGNLQENADLYGKHLRHLQKLRKRRAVELAEVEGKGSDGETTEVHEG